MTLTAEQQLVERLRAACNGHPHAKIAWPHRILHEAAATITRLVEERDRWEAACDSNTAIGAEIAEKLKAGLDAAEAKVSELTEALKPFADYCDELDGFLDNHDQPIPDDQGPGWVYVTIGDFRRAARALQGSAKQ